MSTAQPNTAKPPTPPLVKIETQYKRFLARRWFDFAWRAGVYTGLVTATSIYTSTGQSSSLATEFLFGFLAFIFLIHPILHVRRSYITDPPRIPIKKSVISNLISSFTFPRSLKLLTSYAIFAAAFAGLYCGLVQIHNPSRDFWVLSSTKRHPWHLNERPTFLILGNVSFFVLLGVIDLISTNSLSIWPKRKTPIFVTAQRALYDSLGSVLDDRSVLLAFFPFIFSISYFATHRSVATFLAIRLWPISAFLRPFIVNFARTGKSNVSWSMIFHLYSLVITSLAIMRPPTTVLGAYVTHPLTFGAFARKSPLPPDRYLLEALRSKNKYYLHFTLMELLRISRDPARRRAIFADISKQPVLIHEIWQQLLLHLGQAHHLLSTRGGRLSFSRPLPAARPSAPDPRSIALKQADIFRPVSKQKSTIGLALQNVLDGPIRPTPPQLVQAEQKVLRIEDKALKQIADVQNKVVGQIEGIPAGEAVLAQTRGWLDVIYAWAGRTWAIRSVRSSVPDEEAVVWVIDIFATLAVASADEDTYGHVQQVLPATLEAIVRLRTALLIFQNELLAQASGLGRAGGPASEQVKKLLGPTINASEVGILRVAERFGKSLSAFKFPPSIASSLQEICKPLEKLEQVEGE